jgi:hypothetical protein
VKNTRKSVEGLDPTILSELVQLDIDIAQLETRRAEIISEIPTEVGSRTPNVFSIAGKRRKPAGDSPEIPVAMLVMPNSMQS